MELLVENTADGVMLKPATPFPPTRLDEVGGMARYTGRRLSIAEMDEAV